MEITFNELISNYPVSMLAIANNIGKSRQWIHFIQHSSKTKRPELMRKHYLNIQNHLREWGSMALNISAHSPDLIKLLQNSPLSLPSVSLDLGKGRFWLRDISTGTLKPSTDDRLLIAQSLQSMGSILHNIVLLDFIEHDYVASHLVNQNKFNGLVV
jgi:hypothetical protein